MCPSIYTRQPAPRLVPNNVVAVERHLQLDRWEGSPELEHRPDAAEARRVRNVKPQAAAEVPSLRARLRRCRPGLRHNGGEREELRIAVAGEAENDGRQKAQAGHLGLAAAGKGAGRVRQGSVLSLLLAGPHAAEQEPVLGDAQHLGGHLEPIRPGQACGSGIVAAARSEAHGLEELLRALGSDGGESHALDLLEHLGRGVVGDALQHTVSLSA
mmetsp:Transcript_59380/g.173707  ORF Transcript_59380/g.173707 Transcript_59380/m.173707 type:complete len:214 (+) Transcript_59380:28-669(+)